MDVDLEEGDGAAVSAESNLEIASKTDSEFLLFDLEMNGRQPATGIVATVPVIAVSLAFIHCSHFLSSQAGLRFTCNARFRCRSLLA